MKIRGWIGGGVKFLNEKNTPFVFRKFSSFYSNVYLLMHVNQQSTFACVAKGDSFTVVSRCTPCGIIAFHSFRYTCSIWNNILRSALSLSLAHTHTHTHVYCTEACMFIAQKHASNTQWNWSCFTLVTSVWMKNIYKWCFSRKLSAFYSNGLNACESTVHSCLCGESGLLHCCQPEYLK